MPPAASSTSADGLDQAVEQIFRVALQALGVFIDAFGVQQAGVQGADGQVEPVLDGVEIDLVAQDVPVDRLQKREATGLQPLEQVGAAKTHQPLARTPQVLDELAFGRRGAFLGRRVHIVAQAVARHMQRVDGSTTAAEYSRA